MLDLQISCPLKSGPGGCSHASSSRVRVGDVMSGFCLYRPRLIAAVAEYRPMSVPITVISSMEALPMRYPIRARSRDVVYFASLNGAEVCHIFCTENVTSNMAVR